MKFMRTSVLLTVMLVTASMATAANLPDFTQLAEKAGAAVVNIGTEKTNKSGPEDMFGGFMRNAPPGFEKFFEQFQPFNMPRERTQRSLGSGFIVSEDGYIVTNYHVVEDADVINVNLQGATGKSESIPATLVGSDEETDIALLKVETKEKLPFLTFADSDAAKVGEWVMAIGNPFGLQHTVTAGILSAKDRNIHSGPFDNFLQTDASINPGNSGGPLLNMQGQVLGINTAIIASGQGLGFAIPSSMAASITEQLKAGKKVSRGWIGVTIQDLDENSVKALGLEKDKGALISSVMDDGPAHKAGMRDGDVITAVNKKPIDDSAALLRAIASETPGETINVTVWRQGKVLDLNIKLGERTIEQLNAQRGGPSVPEKKQESASLGISVRPLTVDESNKFELAKGVGLLIVEVDRESPAADVGLRNGDVIISANTTPVKTPKELANIIKEATPRGAIMLQVYRQGELTFVAVPLETEKNKKK